MTVEQLHDALTLLPSDLIVAADKRRSRKIPPLHWQRWTAMAACFALVLLAGSFYLSAFVAGGLKTAESAVDQAAAPESPAAMAPAEAAPPAEAEEGPLENRGTGSTAGSFTDGLPHLTLRSGESTQRLMPRGIQWQMVLPDGTASAFQADVSIPTDYPDSLEKLSLPGSTLELIWDREPLSLKIACWCLESGQWAPCELPAGGDLVLPDGDCIVEVTASWEDGHISYAFRKSPS